MDIQPPPLLPKEISADAQTHVPSCLNCSTPTPDRFCPHCGQEATQSKASIQHLVREFIGETFGYDSKLVHTLVPLVTRPGSLTNEYLSGRRAPYLSPFRLYVFFSLLFFVTLAWRDSPQNLIKQATDEQTAAKLSADKPAPPVPPDNKISFSFADKPGEKETIDLDTLPKTIAEYDAQQRDPKNKNPDAPSRQFFTKRVILIKQMGMAAFVGRILNNLPKMMFVMLPLFALLLKFIYWRSRRLYIEHLLFALHCHAFLFFALTVMELLQTPAVSGLFTLWLMIYLFWAMRVVYRQGWVKTLCKFGILGIVYFTVLGILLLGTIFVTFVTV